MEGGGPARWLDPRCDLRWPGAGDKAGDGEKGSGSGFIWEGAPASAEGGVWCV